MSFPTNIFLHIKHKNKIGQNNRNHTHAHISMTQLRPLGDAIYLSDRPAWRHTNTQSPNYRSQQTVQSRWAWTPGSNALKYFQSETVGCLVNFYFFDNMAQILWAASCILTKILAENLAKREDHRAHMRLSAGQWCKQDQILKTKTKTKTTGNKQRHYVHLTLK